MEAHVFLLFRQFNIPPQVAIEENNRNTLTQLSKFKKFQSQISEDFTKQFSVLEKLLDEFTTGEVGI